MTLWHCSAQACAAAASESDHPSSAGAAARLPVRLTVIAATQATALRRHGGRAARLVVQVTAVATWGRQRSGFKNRTKALK